MTATERGFLDDIIENPADDVPRLIYADWLQDHGDPDRAEFIRVQCELAVTEGYSARHALALREWRLWADNAHVWGRVFDTDQWGKVYDERGYPTVPVAFGSGDFRRGFLYTAQAKLGVLRDYLPGLVRLHPVGQVIVTDLHSVQSYRWDDEGAVSWRLEFPLIDYMVLVMGLPREHFPTREALDAATSAAILAWARREAR